MLKILPILLWVDEAIVLRAVGLLCLSFEEAFEVVGTSTEGADFL